MTETRHYVAVLPDGTEHGFEVKMDTTRPVSRYLGWQHEITRELERIVRQAGITTNRKTPQAIPVPYFCLEIQGTTLQRRPVATPFIMPPLANMTEDEFVEEEAALLAKVPYDFRAALSYQAYEDGHYAGREEVLLILNKYIDCLVPAIQAYTKRVQAISQGFLSCETTEPSIFDKLLQLLETLATTDTTMSDDVYREHLATKQRALEILQQLRGEDKKQ